MKRGGSARLNIGHGSVQEVKAPKGSTGGNKPQKQTGTDLRCSK